MRRYSSWLFWLVILAGVAQTFLKIEPGIKNDFDVFYRTSQRLLAHQWEDLYNIADGAFPFRYTPVMLLAFLPWAWMPALMARKAWFVSQALSMLVGLLIQTRVLKLLKFKSAQFVSLLAFVLTLRFSLDGLFCGQISGWNYLFFTSSLYFLLRGRAVLGPWVLVVPTLLKLGPGILVLHTLRPRVREVLLFAAASAAFFLILHGALWAYVGEHSVIPMLWQKWQFIVSEDARYFNGATGRNQTLRGFLLRAFAGTYSLDEIQSIWKVLVVACCGLSFAWVVGILRQNWTARTVYLRFCVGILCLVIFMPQSLPYGWVHLSFPIAYFLGILLESREKGLAAWRSPEGGGLLLFFVCCSIPGPSLVGRDMAEWLLEHSVPFWVSLGVLLNCYRLMADQKVSELT